MRTFLFLVPAPCPPLPCGCPPLARSRLCKGNLTPILLLFPSEADTEEASKRPVSNDAGSGCAGSLSWPGTAAVVCKFLLQLPAPNQEGQEGKSGSRGLKGKTAPLLLFPANPSSTQSLTEAEQKQFWGSQASPGQPETEVVVSVDGMGHPPFMCLLLARDSSHASPSSPHNQRGSVLHHP